MVQKRKGWINMVRLADPSDIPRILDIYAPYIRSTTVTF